MLSVPAEGEGQGRGQGQEQGAGWLGPAVQQDWDGEVSPTTNVMRAMMALSLYPLNGRRHFGSTDVTYVF